VFQEDVALYKGGERALEGIQAVMMTKNIVPAEPEIGRRRPIHGWLEKSVTKYNFQMMAIPGMLV
jgi:hypothetical protein